MYNKYNKSLRNWFFIIVFEIGNILECYYISGILFKVKISRLLTNLQCEVC